ncbi:MAG: hypothetical protein PWQ97_701 [Tepidanaerobacteraceae bacterium]|nr:hypothetical protein [Tepidanaerobacteraceae bacterium]
MLRLAHRLEIVCADNLKTYDRQEHQEDAKPAGPQRNKLRVPVVEHSDKAVRKKLRDNKPYDDDTRGRGDGQPQRFFHPVEFPGAVIVSYDGLGALVNAEYGHQER